VALGLEGQVQATVVGQVVHHRVVEGARGCHLQGKGWRVHSNCAWSVLALPTTSEQSLLLQCSSTADIGVNGAVLQTTAWAEK
jgi:hypothetical protein